MFKVRKLKKIKIDNEWIEVRESPIHGYGCFAIQTIPKDQRILEYVGEKITKAESNRRGLLQEEIGKRNGDGLVYIFELNKRHDIDGNVPENTARYVNHSCEPNCEAVNIRGRIWYVALRDIEEGEEIYIDYGYDMEHFMDHPCLCGTQSCIGYIVHKSQRWRVRRILANRKKKAAVKKPPAGRKKASP